MDQAAHYQKNKEALIIKRRAYFLATRDMVNARLRESRARMRVARQAEQAAAAAATS